MGASAPEDAGDVDAVSPRPAGLRILAIGAIVLVLLIAVAAVLSASRGPATFEEGTPEAAVQGYLDAMIEGDESAAHAFLSDELGCTVRDLRERRSDINNARVALRAVSIDSDEAEVDVSITENSGEGPFGGGGYTFEETFVLGREGGAWVIAEEPWPIYFCS